MDFGFCFIIHFFVQFGLERGEFRPNFQLEKGYERSLPGLFSFQSHRQCSGIVGSENANPSHFECITLVLVSASCKPFEPTEMGGPCQVRLSISQKPQRLPLPIAYVRFIYVDMDVKLDLPQLELEPH